MFSSISRCPFGQAYVRFNSAADRDRLISRGPIPFDNVHIVFQKHNEGMNWRSFNLNREVWLLLVGFPADLRNFHELSNAVAGFGKLLVWDRVKTTDAAVAIKVRIDVLQDIPISIVVSDANQLMSHSWTCPVVIFQDQPLGGPLAEEDPIPVDGNPHPDLLKNFITPIRITW